MNTMEKLTDTLQSNPLALAALAYGLYAGLGRLKNLRDGQGCPKCETVQMYAGFALAAFAAYTLYQESRSRS